MPDTIKGLDDRLEYLLRPHGVMRRNVQLQKGWYKDAVGAMLAWRKEDGSVVALIPKGLTGYAFFDEAAAKWVRITKQTEERFEDEAICFYKPFPLTKLTVPKLMRYVAECIDKADIILAALSAFLVSLVGLLTPWLTALLFGRVAESGSVQLLLVLAVFMVSVSVSQLLLRSINMMLTGRVTAKLNLSVQAATMIRILSLPADFLKSRAAANWPAAADAVPVPDVGVGGAEYGLHIPVFSDVRDADIRLCTDAGSPCPDDNPGDAGIFHLHDAVSYADRPKADGTLRAGKRHELCADHRHPENQALRC